MGGAALSCFVLALAATPHSDAASAAPARVEQTVASEKEARTPAQRKINSQLLFEIYRRRGDAERKGIPTAPTSVKIDARGRALVDVRAPVTTRLQNTIRSVGGAIISTSTEHHSIIARVPLLALERLAEERDIRFIEPAADATTVRPPPDRE